MAWEDVKSILRPEGVNMGVMSLDEETCTQCGLCIENCPFSCWEDGDEGYPVFKEKAACFSCYNCQVACDVDAISLVESYHVKSGFWATAPNPLPARMPLLPQDEEGEPTEWNVIERAILERRSVRNFKDKPVPDTIIRRVLEAGRFAPSAGNSQPWKFVVVTDRALIKKMDDAVQAMIAGADAMYMDDEQVKNMAPAVENNPNPGGFDPRIAMGGMGVVARGELPASLNAPVVIFIAGDSRGIGDVGLTAGICGQNMNIVANSLGIKACWSGFIAAVGGMPEINDKLGFDPTFSIISALVLGYPKFKQEGMVPREFRPVTWFREGSDGPEIDE